MINIVNEAMPALSGSLAASIVVKATVMTALALMVTRLMRTRRAAVRHAVLATLFGVLAALPCASILAPPLRMALPAVAAELNVSSPPAVIINTTQPAVPALPNARAVGWRWPEFFPGDALLLTWLAGLVLCLLPVIRGLRQVHSLRRSGLRWQYGQALVDAMVLDFGINRRVNVVLHESLAGPMTCGIVHPAIVLPPDAQTWDAEDLNRALVHELEHVRRGDWVSHCVARVVCAAYWFHPLVWIASRHLGLEAERSCDDAVLGRSEATAYADQLVRLAQRRLKLPALAMANRADLATRVVAVLDARQRRGRAGKILVAISCVTAAALIFAISPFKVVAAQRSGSQAGGSLPSFEVASIRPCAYDDRAAATSPRLWGDTTGKVSLQHMPLQYLLMHSYDLQPWQLSGPAWLTAPLSEDSPLFNILATVPAGAPKEQIPLMFQSLLVERFNLKFHWETQSAQVLALVVGRGGHKLKAAVPADPEMKDGTSVSGAEENRSISITSVTGPFGPAKTTIANGAMHTELQSVTMPGLVRYLSQGQPGLPALPVVDVTGLTGLWQVALDISGPANGEASDPTGGSILDSLHKLGLDLVKRNGTTEKFVVDQIEKTATPN